MSRSLPTRRVYSLQRRGRPARLGLGFTLVELMLVVSILGILAALVVPKYVNAQDDAAASALAGNVKMIREQITLYHAKHGVYPDDIDAGWFAGGVPEHPENKFGMPTIQTLAAANLSHPAQKVLYDGGAGAYIYNSVEGTFNARVGDKGSAAATLDFYNKVNNSSETALGNYGGGGGGC